MTRRRLAEPGAVNPPIRWRTCHYPYNQPGGALTLDYSPEGKTMTDTETPTRDEHATAMAFAAEACRRSGTPEQLGYAAVWEAIGEQGPDSLGRHAWGYVRRALEAAIDAARRQGCGHWSGWVVYPSVTDEDMRRYRCQLRLGHVGHHTDGTDSWNDDGANTMNGTLTLPVSEGANK